MSISMCRRISMALVVCICASFCLLPFRAAAGQVEIDNLAEPVLAQWRRLNSILPTDKEHAAQVLRTLFIQYDVDVSFSSVAVEDLEGVAKTFSQIGISAVFKEVALPSGGYGWVLQCDSIESFPVNIYGLYAPGGRIIYSPSEEEDDSAATSSRPSYTAPSTNVDIEYTQVFDSTTNTWVDVEINKYDQSVTNNTTNNNHYWDVDNRQFWDVENNTYTTYNDITYNPSTQTYNVQFSDNRSYTYQFYYEYTYITYIGSSAEYREAYKVYYQLPDGRSSGDLTADEIKGLSLQFGLVKYDKTAGDTLTRLLLPFDGSLDNNAYFSAPTPSFLNTAGYTFLESPDPFGGYIYNQTGGGYYANAFRADLGTPFGKGSSFTYQGRFYVGGTFSGDPVYLNKSLGFCLYGKNATNNTVWLYDLFSVVGSTLYLYNGHDEYEGWSWYTYPCAVGVWHDFCFVFDTSNDTIHFYLDGVKRSYPYGIAVSPVGNITSVANNSWYEGYSFSLANCTLMGIGYYQGNASAPLGVDNLRLVAHPLYTGSSCPVSQAPFDTNLIYVLPSIAELEANTVAIMTTLPVNRYQVGGVRPSDPRLAAGFVYMHIDGEFIDSVQLWNGAYWEEVTARLYTGVRWIPVTAFNVFTLEDMFDIVDPDGDGGGESVSTIYQYYLWWSGEWGTFQQWLQGTMETLIEAIQNSGSGGSGGPVTIVPGYNDQTTTNEITTENPDGSTTVTTIVSNAAGLVYSRSVTTWPPDAEGNVTTREVYTDSSGVMYQTTIITDRDGNVTITEPSEATGTLASILKTITQGVMSIATTVIEAFVNLLVDLVGFVLDSVGRIFTGITNILATLLSAITSFVAELGAAAQFLPAFFSILPAPIQSGFTLIFVGCVAIGLFRLIHF